VFGEEYFRDHVHTNLEGYRLLGLELLALLVEQGVVTPDVSWTDARRELTEREVIAGLDPRIEGHVSMNLGKVLEWAGKLEEAYRSFKRALEILGPSPMTYDRLGRSSFILEKYDDTIRYMREALALYPEMTELHVNLALALAKQGKTDEAIEHYWAEIELDPTSHLAHAGLANLLAQQGDEVGAREHYELSLQIKPDFEYALIKLAYLLIRQGRHDEALTYARNALRTNPKQYRAHNALGLIMKKQGKIEQAMRHFSEALRLAPG
jgi:tetratricopeptide (TPR) repeat protein